MKTLRNAGPNGKAEYKVKQWEFTGVLSDSLALRNKTLAAMKTHGPWYFAGADRLNITQIRRDTGISEARLKCFVTYSAATARKMGLAYVQDKDMAFILHCLGWNIEITLKAQS